MTVSKPPTLSAQALAARLGDYGLNTQAQISALMMGGVFATAAMAFADIIRTPDDRYIRLTLWLAMVLGSIIVLSAQVTTNLLAARAQLYVTVNQLLWGFLAASGFACISIAAAGPDGWRVTYLLAIGQYVLSWSTLLWAPALFARNAYAPDLHPLLDFMMEQMTRSTWSSMLSFPIALAAAGIAWVAKDAPNPWEWVILAINVALVLQTGVMLTFVLKRFSRLVENVEQARAAAAARERGEIP